MTDIDKDYLRAIASAYLPKCLICGRVATSEVISHGLKAAVCDDHRIEPYTSLREAVALRAIQQAIDAGHRGYTPTQQSVISILQSVAAAWYACKWRSGICMSPDAAWLSVEFARASLGDAVDDTVPARKMALNALLAALDVRHIMDAMPREDLLAAVAKAIRTVRGGAT